MALVMRLPLLPVIVCFCAWTAPLLAQPVPGRVDDLLDQGMNDFANGRIRESVAAFDEIVKLAPRLAPELWQRGISLYYAGRFQDCRAQFELHRTVNPDDVENAAWHFLCVTRARTPAAARAALLPVGPDARKPMTEIYQMFRGTTTPDQVLAAGAASRGAEFYAHLYVGLYFDVTGNRPRALEQLKLAALDRYALDGGYMHAVALVHLRTLQGTN